MGHEYLFHYRKAIGCQNWLSTDSWWSELIPALNRKALIPALTVKTFSEHNFFPQKVTTFRIWLEVQKNRKVVILMNLIRRS